MKAYSEDLRKKIVGALLRGTRKSEAARLFGVSLSSVKRYVRTACEGRSLTPKRNPGKLPKLGESARVLLKADLDERPAATLSQRRSFLQDVTGVLVSNSTASRLIKRLRFTRKKDRWVLAKGTSG